MSAIWRHAVLVGATRAVTTRDMGDATAGGNAMMVAQVDDQEPGPCDLLDVEHDEQRQDAEEEKSAFPAIALFRHGIQDTFGVGAAWTAAGRRCDVAFPMREGQLPQSKKASIVRGLEQVVETRRIELPTFALRTRRSPS